MSGRSTLEVMLESLNQRNENPGDAPPALPQRPLSKARLPSMNRIRKAIPGVSGFNENEPGGLPEFRQIESNDLQFRESFISNDNANEVHEENRSANSFESFDTVQSKARLPSMNRIGKAFPAVSGFNENEPGGLPVFRQMESNDFPFEESVMSRDNANEADKDNRSANSFESIDTVSMNRIRKGFPAISGFNENDAGGLAEFRQMESNDFPFGESVMSSVNANEADEDNRSANSFESIDNVQSAQSSEITVDKKRKASEITQTAEADLQAEDHVRICMDLSVVAGEENADSGQTGLQGVSTNNDLADTYQACNNTPPTDLGTKTLYWCNQVVKDTFVNGDKFSGTGHEAVECLLRSDDEIPSTSHRIASGNWKNSTLSAMKENSLVWCLNADNKWILGRILYLVEGKTTVRAEDSQLPENQITTILPANPHVLDGVDDLRQLSYLNEPSILYNLQFRYAHGKTYTEAGPLLISLNQFNQLHTNDSAQLYRIVGTDPHVYKKADNALEALLEGGGNQSIIMSGESGTGKTQNANLAMQYLVSIGSNVGNKIEISKVNRVLEAFGNAKTLINENSSRFAKLVDIYFNDHGKVCGVKVQTCLLAKSRVVHRAKGERSYHIFYQLCSSLDPALQEHLFLRPAREFEYLKQSECMVLDNFDDLANFDLTLEALETLKFNKQDQGSLLRLLSAILWLGNIKISVCDDDNHASVVDDIAVETVAKLLKCDKEHLIATFSTRTLYGDHLQKLTYNQAVCSRNAFAMAIYGCMFDWLVSHLNKSIEVAESCIGKSISILDICGFETNERNSLEQMCINYANERIQQFLSNHFFELEKKIYNSEGIDSIRFELANNQDCVELFEKGLFPVLDEECRVPNRNDIDLAYKLKEKLVGNRRFKADVERGFKIHHNVREVFYEVTGLLDKNREFLLSEEQLSNSCELEFLWCSTANIIQDIQELISPGDRTNGKLQQQSVTSKFQAQISQFLQQLEKTTPHFIYCIKPSTIRIPGLFEQDIVLQQLRCCRVIDIVRLSKFGYPIRLSHDFFASRYRFLLPHQLTVQPDDLSISVAILRQFSVPLYMCLVGYTKLFFREGQVEKLEEYRRRILRGIICIQKVFRGYKVRCHLYEVTRAASVLQSLFRRQCIRRRLCAKKHLEKEYAVLKEAVTADKTALPTSETCNGSSVSEAGALNKSCITEPKVDLGSEMTSKILPSVVADLERRILVAESRAKEKEVTNTSLQQQLGEYETRLKEYQEKLKYLEENCQIQIASLQSSLSAAEERLRAEELASQTCERATSPDPQFKQQITKPGETINANGVDIDNKPLTGTNIPEENPALCSPVHAISCRKGDQDDGRSVVSHLTKELEHRTRVFKDDTEFLVEVKSGKSQVNLNPEEELQKLTRRFHTWKKDFKIRLYDTKKLLQKLGKMESASKTKKWWRRIAY